MYTITYAYTDGNLTYVVNPKGDGITITRCNTYAEGEIPEAYTVAGQTLNVTENVYYTGDSTSLNNITINVSNSSQRLNILL